MDWKRAPWQKLLIGHFFNYQIILPYFQNTIFTKQNRLDNLFCDVFVENNSPANEKVLWFHIPIDEVLSVDVLHKEEKKRCHMYFSKFGRKIIASKEKCKKNSKMEGINQKVEKKIAYLHSRQQLHRQHKDGFEGETTITQVEKVLQTWTKQFHDQGIVLSAGSEIKDAGYTFHWKAKKIYSSLSSQNKVSLDWLISWSEAYWLINSLTDWLDRIMFTVSTVDWLIDWFDNLEK